MEESKNMVLTEIVRMCYDVISEEAKGKSEEEKFYEVFTDEIAESEINSLKEYGFEFEKKSHPVNAMNMYRNSMVMASSYTFINEVVPVVEDDKHVKINFKKCRYRDICGAHKESNFCIRGWAYVFAVKQFSDGTARMLRRNYDPMGNCNCDLEVIYENLMEIPSFENDSSRDFYRVLTKDEYLNIVLESWLKGIENAAIKVFGDAKGKEFLRKIHGKLVDRWIEKFFKIDYYIGYPVSQWKNGELLFNEEINL